MRIAVDATPAAVQNAGVGRYTRELLAALVGLPGDDQYILASAAADGENQQLLRALPPGQFRDLRRLPLNPRLTTAAWQRLRLPLNVESLIGDFEVFHGPDFVVPPSRRPRVVTIHDLSFLLTPQFGDPRLVRYLTAVVPRALDAATIVVSVSAAVAAEVANAYSTARDKLIAIPNGVRFPQNSPKRNTDSRPSILTVGTVEPRKNHSTLIDALPIVRATHPDAILTIAGRVGWQSDEIAAQIRAAEASGVVHFVESPNDADLDALYASASVAVFPSYYEGFGLPVLEAMARGVPVVSSNIASLRETGGAAACYADPTDPESVAYAIVRLLDDRALRERHVTLGIAQAAQFSWHETARRTRRAYSLAKEGKR